MASFFHHAKGFKVGTMDIENVDGDYTDRVHEEIHEEDVGQVHYDQTHAVGVVNGDGDFAGTIIRGGRRKDGNKRQTRNNASRSQTAPARAQERANGYGCGSNHSQPGHRSNDGPPRPNLPKRGATFFPDAEDFEVEKMGVKNVGGNYVNRRTANTRKTYVQEKRFNQEHAIGVVNGRGNFTGTINSNEQDESEEEYGGDGYDSQDGRGGHPPPDRGGPDHDNYSDEEGPLIDLHDQYQPSQPRAYKQGSRNVPQGQRHWEPTYRGNSNRWDHAQQQHQPTATQSQQRGRQAPSAPVEEHGRTYRRSPHPNNRQSQRGFSPRPREDHQRRETLLDDYDDGCVGIQTPPLTPGKFPRHGEPQGGSGARGYGGTARASRKRAPPGDRDLGELTVQMEKMSVKNPEVSYASPPLTGNQYRGDTAQYF